MQHPHVLGLWFKPSLAKAGLLGIALCLALGAYAPPASTGQTMQVAEAPADTQTATPPLPDKAAATRTSR